MAHAFDSTLQPDRDAIHAFLSETLIDGLHLAAITPDGPVSFWHFGADVDAAANWAVAENRRGRGMYFTTNRVRDGLHDKPKKGDITEARFGHVDIDPPKNGDPFDKRAVLDELRALRREPSFVIDSGGGLGAFWRLDEPAMNLPAIETINQGIADRFDADHCWNIDRLMRLPGTVNWPNRKKIAAGRTPAMAAVLVEDQGLLHEPMALAAEFPRKAAREQRQHDTDAGPTAFALITADDLGLGPFDALRSLIDHPNGRDRSGDAYACAGEMHRRRCTDEQILGVLLNPANAVSAHILDQRDPRYQALKCLNKTRTEEGSAAHGAQVADGLGFGKGVGSERGRTRFDDHGADAELIEQTRRTNEGLDELPGQMDPAEWNGRQAPYRCFIIPGWIIRGSAGLLSGEEGVGKSLLGQQMATSAAAYRPFLGLEIASVKSVYISCEDPLDEMWRRQEGINTALGINMNALAGRLKLVSLKGHLGNELCNIDNGRLKAAPRFKQIYRTCREFGANLVFLDNAAHFFPGNENDRHEVAAFLGLLERLAEDIDGAVILLAHPNKQFAQGNKQGNEYSGSTGWSAHVRNRLFLDWAAKNDDGTPVDDDGRLLRKSKANYGKKGEEIAFRWHEWAFSTPDTLGPNVAAQLSTTIQANSENDVYLRCLDTLTEQRRNVSHSPNAMNYAPRAMAKMTEGKGIGLKALERAHERLMHIRQILADQELWRKGPSDRHFVRGIARNPAWEGVGRSTGTPWQSGTSTPQETAKNDVWEAPWEGPWEGRGKVWEGSSQPIENACGTVDALSVHNTTYKEGAAQEAAAPSWETEPKPAASATQLPASPDATDKPDLSRVIFGPLPEDQRDPFNPADWPENDDDR